MNENKNTESNLDEQVEVSTENTVSVENQSKKNDNTPKNGKVNKLMKNKKFKYGSMSTIFVVVAIALAILLNVFATALVEKFPSLSLDMTSDSKLSLSQTSSDVAKNVTEDVSIIFLAPKETIESNYGTEGVSMTTIASKLAEASGNKVKVEYVDLEANPTFKSSYDETLTADNVIVKSAKRHRTLAIQKDLLSYNSTQQVWTNVVDMGLASALLSVTSDKLPTVAFAKGHGETSVASFESFLQSNNFETSELDFLNVTEIDKKIDVIVFNAPIYDFTDDQIKVLETFLDNDGLKDKDVVFAATTERQATPKLDAFLSDWGIKMGDPSEYVVETETARYNRLPLYPFLQLNDSDDSILKELSTSTKPILGAAGVTMEQSYENKTGFESKVWLHTYNSATKMNKDEEYTDDFIKKAETKEYPFIINTSTGVSRDNQYITSSVTMFATDFFFDQSSLQQGNLLNAQIVLSIFKNLTGTTGDENSVYIEPKSVSTQNTAMSTAQMTTFGLIIFTIALPLIVLILGIVVWFRRRHL